MAEHHAHPTENEGRGKRQALSLAEDRCDGLCSSVQQEGLSGSACLADVFFFSLEKFSHG